MCSGRSRYQATPAVTERPIKKIPTIRDLAVRMAAASHDERGQLIGDFAELYGWSRQTVYRHLQKEGWSSGRKRRADAGTSAVDDRTLATIAGMLKVGVRRNGKATMMVPTARSILAANGHAVPVGNAQLTRLLRQRHQDLFTQRQPRAWHAQRSAHPNHVHLVDPSLCLIYYLPEGGQRVIRDDEAYKNKPENLERIGDLKVWRYVLVDHYTATVVVRYYQARGESAANLFDFLLYAWQRREGRAFHGVPKILYWDKGSANTAAVIKNALAALDVAPIEHEAGNPRAKGAVEKANHLVETLFETRLKYEPVRDVDELNAAAEAWSLAFNANVIPEYDSRVRRIGMREPMSRYGLWQTIRPDHLRILPDVEVCRYLLSASPKERQVRGDLTVSFRHPAAKRSCYYDVSNIPGVHARSVVSVSALAYGNCSVLVHVHDYLGDEQTYELEPIAFDEVSGFRLDAALIGEEFKRQPDTVADTAGKRADAALFPGLTADEIKAAKDKNLVPLGGTIDAHSHLADVVPPSFMRRPGTALDVPNRKYVEAKLITPVQAAIKLQRVIDDPTVSVPYLEYVSQRYPEGLTEPQFEALVHELLDELQPSNDTPIRVIK